MSGRPKAVPDEQGPLWPPLEALRANTMNIIVEVFRAAPVLTPVCAFPFSFFFLGGEGLLIVDGAYLFLCATRPTHHYQVTETEYQLPPHLQLAWCILVT